MDDDKKADEVKPDEKSSDDTPAVDKTSSQKPAAFTKEQEAEVQKRVSDIRAERGDKATILEAKVEEQAKFIEVMKAAQLATAATKYGLTVEKLKEAGIDDPKKIEAYATLFGKTGDEHKDDPKPDSGETVGGGLSDEAFITKLGSGEEAITKEDLARAKKLGIFR